MRIDHIAYQRATRVSGFGFLLQAGIGIALLVFGLVSADTAFVFGSLYVLSGLIVWTSLIVIFYQHAQARLEALEQDELATTRAGAGSVFDAEEDDIRIAARRLRLMHKWLMPTVSLLFAFALSGLAWRMLVFMRHLDDVGQEAVDTGTDFHLTPHLGWAVAICLGFAAVSFIFSRFVAGMAKQAAWQNLRGGAGCMVGGSLVMLAIAVGIIFRFFDNDAVIEGIALGIVIVMFVLAGEVLLNFILNLYRPRIPGDTPRPAFDSRILSQFAAPDNIVRTINDAVNYQFGFDITSSWGYRLLLRSFAWLIALGVIVLVLLNMMVVVEPHQQAVRLSHGAIVGDQTYAPGIMWKLPWPFQTAAVYDVTRVRDLQLTAKRRPRIINTPNGPLEVDFWSDEPKTDVEIRPFIVRSIQVSGSRTAATTRLAALNDIGDPLLAEEAAASAASEVLSLVDAELSMQYRIQRDGGLMNFLTFVPDASIKLQRLSMRELALRNVTLGVVTRHLSSLTLDDVLTRRRSDLAADLRHAVQQAMDEQRTGIEVVAINILMLRPSGAVAASFENVAMSRQARLQRVADANRNVNKTFSNLLGDPDLAESVFDQISRYDDLRSSEDQAALPLRSDIDQVITSGGGLAASIIARAEKDRWVEPLTAAAEAAELRGELQKYKASPRIYRARETMKVYMQMLTFVRKYIVGIDAERLTVDVDLHELNPILDFSQSVPEEKRELGQ